jgi:hypothetical protein
MQGPLVGAGAPASLDESLSAYLGAGIKGWNTIWPFGILPVPSSPSLQRGYSDRL